MKNYGCHIFSSFQFKKCILTPSISPASIFLQDWNLLNHYKFGLTHCKYLRKWCHYWHEWKFLRFVLLTEGDNYFICVRAQKILKLFLKKYQQLEHIQKYYSDRAISKSMFERAISKSMFELYVVKPLIFFIQEKSMWETQKQS